MTLGTHEEGMIIGGDFGIQGIVRRGGKGLSISRLYIPFHRENRHNEQREIPTGATCSSCHGCRLCKHEPDDLTCCATVGYQPWFDDEAHFSVNVCS